MNLSTITPSASFSPKEIAVQRFDLFPGRPTIVFLHDSLGCIALWRDFPEKLGRLSRCNVLVYDRQGYGKSAPFAQPNREKDYMHREADFLSVLLDAWSLDDVVLFGHSDGGSIALLAAAKFPEKIGAIIAEAAHIFVEDITLEGIRHTAGLYETTDLKVRLEKYHSDKTGALFDAWAGTWQKPDFHDWNIESYLPLITCPALIIQGETDEYGTLRQVTEAVRQISGPTQTFIIPEIGHTPHKEVPELVLEKSAAFIREVVGE